MMALAESAQVFLSWKEHSKSLRSNIIHFLQENTIVDVRIECGTGGINAHKLVLASSSGYFKEKVGFCQPGHVTLHLEELVGTGISTEDLKCIIDFIYTGEIAVTEDKLENMMVLATLFGVYGLEDTIRAAINLTMTPKENDVFINSSNVFQNRIQHLIQSAELVNNIVDHHNHMNISLCECDTINDNLIVASTTSHNGNIHGLNKLSEFDQGTHFVSACYYTNNGDHVERGTQFHGVYTSTEDDPVIQTVDMAVQTDLEMKDLEKENYSSETKHSCCDQFPKEYLLPVIYSNNVEVNEDVDNHLQSELPSVKNKTVKRKPKSRNKTRRKPQIVRTSLRLVKSVEHEKISKKGIESCNGNVCRPSVTEKGFCCLMCCTSFESATDLIRHKQVCTGRRRCLSCTECGEKCNSNEALKMHKWKAHKMGKSYKCDVCDHVTPIRLSLLKHIATHKTTKDYSCPNCDKIFKSRGGLNIHARVHMGDDGKFKCNVCSFTTLQKYNLIKHMATQHGKDLDGKELKNNIKCPHCAFTCIAQHILKMHILRKHCTEKRFKCESCDYATVEKSSLDKHMRIRHTHERPYMCEICGFSSHTISGMTRHRRSHTKVKPYKCDQCDQQYADLKRLKDHLLKHSNQKPFVCTLCPYATRRKDNLQVHLKRSHTQQTTSSDLDTSLKKFEEPSADVDITTTEPNVEEEPQENGKDEEVPLVAVSYPSIVSQAITVEEGDSTYTSALPANSVIYVNSMHLGNSMQMGYYMTPVVGGMTQMVTTSIPGLEEGQIPLGEELFIVRTPPVQLQAMQPTQNNIQ